jgi:hypothetical protein
VGSLRRDLAPVIDFAERWHAGEWAVSQLHVELDASLTEALEHGAHVLGAASCDRGAYGIAVSAGLVGTRLEPLVRAHECAHVLLRHGTARECRAHDRRALERVTWLAAIVLLVPAEYIRELVLGRRSWGEVAELCGVPPSAVAVRIALHLRLGAFGALAQPLLDWATDHFLGWVEVQAREVQERTGRDIAGSWVA